MIMLFVSHVKLYICTICLQALQMEEDQDDFITKFQVFLESEPFFFNLHTLNKTYLKSTQSLCVL